MNTALIHSYVLDGLDVRAVTVDVAVQSGISTFHIKGLPDRDVREIRERVRTAVQSQGFAMPSARIFVSVGPYAPCADGLALPIAVGVLVAQRQISTIPGNVAIVGEMTLGGEARQSRGAFAIAQAASRDRRSALVLPRNGMAEAAAIEGLPVRCVEWLRDVPAKLDADAGEDRHHARPRPAQPVPSMDEVRGQEDAKRRLRSAAQEGRSVLLIGASGTGKTMLARRVVGEMPPMTPTEAAEVTRIHSIQGLHDGFGLVDQRPFRMPHHKTSRAGLIGGGVMRAIVGEATLAHRGVLLLDRIEEFDEDAITMLRKALAARLVVTERWHLPAAALLIGTASPCPCGWAAPRCRCNEAMRGSHGRRLERLGGMFDEVIVLGPYRRSTGDQG